jgi:hypothetical protein
MFVYDGDKPIEGKKAADMKVRDDTSKGLFDIDTALYLRGHLMDTENPSLYQRILKYHTTGKGFFRATPQMCWILRHKGIRDY